MHFSAKRGIAIACRLSVCLSVSLSVTLVDQDHIGWKSWKQTERTISPTPSLFGAQRSSTYSQGNMGKFWRDYRGGVGKMALWSTKAAISLKRVKIEERNSPTLFRMVPSPTPYGLPFPKIGGLHPTQNSNRYYLGSGLSYELRIWSEQ